MIKPDAIPVRRAAPRAVLSAEATRTLFGAGYALRGSESVRVVRSGRREVRVPAESGPEVSLALGAIERDALGEGPPLRLVGPVGSIAAPAPSAVVRVLRLPAALARAWGLALSQPVTVQAGAVAFGDVVVEEGAGYVALDHADLLAARLSEGDTVCWRPQLTLDLPKPTPEAAPPNVRATGRLITENDVRQARLRGQQIIVGPGHLITPAARSLGRELGVLDDA